MEREINQRRGQNGDQQRHQEEIAGKPVRRLPQRQLVDHDLDELRAAGRRPHHADRLVAGFHHHLERVDDRRPHRHGPHVDIVVDRRGQVGAGQEPSLLPHLDSDRPRADAGQDLPRQRIRNHAERRCIEHQGCGIGRGQAVVESVHPEIRDRGHIDQYSRDHHQRNGSVVGCSSVDDTIFAFDCPDSRMRSGPRRGQITDR